jgi:hypothetical protein
MPNVLILLGQPEVEPLSQVLGVALQHAIEEDFRLQRSPVSVEMIRGAELAQRLSADPSLLAHALVCPLTLEIPEGLNFPNQTLYHTCRDVDLLQQQVQQWGYAVGRGTLWLPIVQTARGTLYGEVIGQAARGQGARGQIESSYSQPVPLTDQQRSWLYPLGLRLIQSLPAPPGVYLMQFGLEAGLEGQRLQFDRLWPFPAAPAIASRERQSPDLFTCHWQCIGRQPLRDLMILGKG